jgi:hypothetical protein
MGTVMKSLTCAALAALTCGAATASEDYDLRYAPGVGGADMSAPYEGGWVFQSPLYNYGGHVTSTSAAVTPLSAFGVPIPNATATTTVTSGTRLGVVGWLPRLSYLSQDKVLGAQIGFTALLPLLQKKSSVSIKSVTTTVDAPGLPDANQQFIIGALNAGYTAAGDQLAAANSNSRMGIGDLELSPMMRWSGDSSQVLFIPTIVFPTGDFDPSRASNPGAGKFFTFRPAVQYSYIGDGWDAAGRVAYSINTRNTDTHYRTGNYMNVDAALMKWVDDEWHFGLTGYAVAQTTRDSTSITIDPSTPTGAREAPTLGQKGHVLGLGPELAYIKGAGEYLAEIRVIKEFAADNRPQGIAFWANFSRPF